MKRMSQTWTLLIPKCSNLCRDSVYFSTLGPFPPSLIGRSLTTTSSPAPTPVPPSAETTNPGTPAGPTTTMIPTQDPSRAFGISSGILVSSEQICTVCSSPSSLSPSNSIKNSSRSNDGSSTGASEGIGLATARIGCLAAFGVFFSYAIAKPVVGKRLHSPVTALTKSTLRKY